MDPISKLSDDIFSEYDNLPEHLKNEIFLNINPKYLRILRLIWGKNNESLSELLSESLSELLSESLSEKLPLLSQKQVTKYAQKWYLGFCFTKESIEKWYLGFCFKKESIDPEKSLIKSLKLEYYDLFDQLFSQFLSFSPRKDSSERNKFNRLLNDLLIIAAEIGRIDYLDKFWSLGARSYGIMATAAKFGQIEIVKLMLEGKSDDYSRTLINAATCDNLTIAIEIINLMSDRLRNDYWEVSIIDEYNLAMVNAAKFGRCTKIEIVKLMLEYGAYNYNETMASAAMNNNSIGKIEIIKLMLDSMDQNGIIPNYNKTMKNAAMNDDDDNVNIKIVKLMLDSMDQKGIIPNYNETMAATVKIMGYPTIDDPVSTSTKIEIIKLMLDSMDQKGIIPNYNGTMIGAAEWGRIKIVKLMIDLMVQQNIIPDYNEAMKKAGRSGKIEVVKLMLEYGADNYIETMIGAVEWVGLKLSN